MKKSITMTAWRRPEYTRQVIESLRHCYHIEEYILYPHVETGSPDNIKIFKDIDFMECEIIVNMGRLGGPLNSYNAVSHGFSTDDFVIHIEDDTILAKDCLLFFEYCREKYKDDKTVLSVSATSRNQKKCDPKDYYRVAKRQRFTSQVCGFWKDRWVSFVTEIDFRPGIDHQIEAQRNNRFEVFPLLTRFQNIGKINGFNQYHKGQFSTPLEFYENMVFNKEWAGNHNLKVGTFHE